MKSPMYLIIGCTASGKGKLAAALARKMGGSIISVDSMKVYRRMDIGTAKPGMEIRSQIPHYLIDVVEPWEPFSMGKYIELADQAINTLLEAQSPIIAVGGTAMYLRGLLEGIFQGPPADIATRQMLQDKAQNEGLTTLHKELTLVDPVSAARIHENDSKRLIRALEVYHLTGQPISSFQVQFRSGSYRHPWKIIGLRRDKDEASRRINQRVKRMVEQGLFDEVRTLLDDSHGLGDQASQGVGYAEVIDYFNGKYDHEECIEKIKINSRRLAKHQRTWFRGFNDVHWFDLQPEDTVEMLLSRIEANLV